MSFKIQKVTERIVCLIEEENRGGRGSKREFCRPEDLQVTFLAVQNSSLQRVTP